LSATITSLPMPPSSRSPPSAAAHVMAADQIVVAVVAVDTITILSADQDVIARIASE
jgi:hypothetical protein